MLPFLTHTGIHCLLILTLLDNANLICYLHLILLAATTLTRILVATAPTCENYNYT